MDYDYLRDVKNHIFLSSVSTFDVFVLDMLLYSPLHLPLDDFKKNLYEQGNFLEEQTSDSLIRSLHKLNKIQLLNITPDNTIQVNKEQRKYFEINIQRFNEKNVPGISLFKELLRLIPTHLLMQWYDISNFSDNMFSSIVDRYLSQTHLYTTYLERVKNEEVLYRKILDQVFAPPDFCVTLPALQEMFQISEESLHTALLHLEYNFACVLSYRPSSHDKYVAVVTPFAEWQQYLLESTFQPMEEHSTVSGNHTSTYIQNFSDFINEVSQGCTLDKEKQRPDSDDLTPLPSYMSIAQSLGLIKVEEHTNRLTRAGSLWLKKDYMERQRFFFHHMHCLCLRDSEWHSIYGSSVLEVINKILTTLPNSIWFSFSELIQNITSLLKRESSATLVRKNQNWVYSLPYYPESFYHFLTKMMKLHLFHSGIIQTGIKDGHDMFCITPLGKKILQDE